MDDTPAPNNNTNPTEPTSSPTPDSPTSTPEPSSPETSTPTPPAKSGSFKKTLIVVGVLVVLILALVAVKFLYLNKH